MLRRLETAIVTGIAFGSTIVGCSQRVIYDTQLRPVRDPVLVASVDYGWLAVDTTGTGARAVLQLEIEAPAEAAEYLERHVPTLRCIADDVHRPTKIRQEAPVCPAAREPLESCTPEDQAAGRCALENPAEIRCVHVVRAEFEFEQVPHLDESTHWFTFDQRETEVRWARIEPEPR